MCFIFFIWELQVWTSVYMEQFCSFVKDHRPFFHFCRSCAPYLLPLFMTQLASWDFWCAGVSVRVCWWMKDSGFLIFSFPWLLIDSRLFLNDILAWNSPYCKRKNRTGIFERNYNGGGGKQACINISVQPTDTLQLATWVRWNLSIDNISNVEVVDQNFRGQTSSNLKRFKEYYCRGLNLQLKDAVVMMENKTLTVL